MIAHWPNLFQWICHYAEHFLECSTYTHTHSFQKFLSWPLNSFLYLQSGNSCGLDMLQWFYSITFRRCVCSLFVASLRDMCWLTGNDACREPGLPPGLVRPLTCLTPIPWVQKSNNKHQTDVVYITATIASSTSLMSLRLYLCHRHHTPAVCKAASLILIATGHFKSLSTNAPVNFGHLFPARLLSFLFIVFVRA